MVIIYQLEKNPPLFPEPIGSTALEGGGNGGGGERRILPLKQVCMTQSMYTKQIS